MTWSPRGGSHFVQASTPRRRQPRGTSCRTGRGRLCGRLVAVGGARCRWGDRLRGAGIRCLRCRGFLTLFGLSRVVNIPAASLEDDTDRRHDALHLALAFRACRHRIILHPLKHFEFVLTLSTLVSISGQCDSPHIIVICAGPGSQSVTIIANRAAKIKAAVACRPRSHACPVQESVRCPWSDNLFGAVPLSR